ncbi:aminotransferase class V-fold PLP-dependent enzyme [Thalassomonas sp. RHCl1]|uniref:aminotransferase class V-fold PLP-dependent enzyme n=1 Tax=Thalassomonas sp. RHCl1 TaxID=2995320 RepID=UPI00248D3539|nr:aminotransferase class V-fold PLP-dependent enzyme [Thalassomonas sp. RHCl1]
MTNNKYVLDVAEDFPAIGLELDGTKVTYLDNAATTLKPKVMVDAVNEYYLGISSNVHRGKNYSLELVSNRYEQTRYQVADLLSCAGNEVVFVRNTTEGINLVAHGLELSKEDKVVVFSDAHHSNLLPWMEKATTHAVRTRADGGLDLAHYHELLKLRPKVVALSHCSNVTGVYSPLDDLVKAAKAIGAIVVVDAAQSLPHRRVNMKQLDIDFLVCSAHKMLGPTGIGILAGKGEMLERLKPMLLGGGMVDWVELDNYRLRKIPHRFEAGTPNIAGAYGLGAAIDYLHHVGFDNIAGHDQAMGRLMLDMAQQRDYLQVINSDTKADRGAVLSLTVPGTPNLDDVARTLSDSYGIMCRNGHLCAQPYVSEQADRQVLRISAYLYNTDQDIKLFFDALDELASFMFR